MAVCSFWRQAALNNSELWRNVHCDISDMALAFLERSQGRLIEVGINHGANIDDAVNNAIRDRAEEIQGLRMCVPEDCWEKYEWILSTPSAPHLEMMVLRTDATSWRSHSRLSKEPFCNSLVNLKRLALERVSMPLRSLYLPRLVDLFLSSIPEEFQPTVPELLAMLESTPLLEVLQLKSFGPKESPNIADAVVPTIHLRHLRSIVIDTYDIPGIHASVRKLLSNITTRDRPFIKLLLFSKPLDDAGFIHYLPPHLQPPPEATMCSASFCELPEYDYAGEPKRQIDIALGNFEGYFAFPSGLEGIHYPCHSLVLRHLRVSMLWYAFVRFMQSDNSRVTERLTVLKLTFFDPMMKESWNMDLWEELVGRLNALEHLSIWVTEDNKWSLLPHMMSMLAKLEAPSDAAALDIDPPVLPNLSKLELVERQYSRKGESLFNDLRDFLRFRKDKGRPIEELIIKSSNFPKEQLEEIRPLVSKLDWARIPL